MRSLYSGVLVSVLFVVAGCGGSDDSSTNTPDSGIPFVDVPQGHAPANETETPDGSSPEAPSQALTAEEAALIAESVVAEALGSATSDIQVVTANGATVLSGTVSTDSGSATVDLSIEHVPYSIAGEISIVHEGHTAVVTIVSPTEVSVVVDGSVAVAVAFSVPLDPAIALANAQALLQQLTAPGFGGSVSLDVEWSAGALTIDGTATKGSLSAEFDAVALTFFPLAVDGTVTATDGNHIAVLEFAGSTVTVTLDGQAAGTFPVNPW